MYIWITLSIFTLAGAMISLVNILAAANLGYDTTTEGKAIINRLYYAFLGLTIVSFACAGIVIISIILKKRKKQQLTNR